MLVDHGWWFHIERDDGEPLNRFQYAFWMVASVLINTAFAVGFFIVSLVGLCLLPIVWPARKFHESYHNYRKFFAKEQAKELKKKNSHTHYLKQLKNRLITKI